MPAVDHTGGTLAPGRQPTTRDNVATSRGSTRPAMAGPPGARHDRADVLYPGPLGPFEFAYTPGYEIRLYRQGDPTAQITTVNLRSVTSIVTSKDLNDTAGTFTVALKDRAAMDEVNEMDTIKIQLQGMNTPGMVDAWLGVVDEVRPAGEADEYAAREDVVITGRCTGKYLLVTSLFLPVWNPQGILPTALIFGMGDVTNKTGNPAAGAPPTTNPGKAPGQTGKDAPDGQAEEKPVHDTPYAIFNYLLRNYTYGVREMVGQSGIPNSRFWIEARERFDQKLGWDIPFVQFDEDTVSAALEQLEITGFSEAWVDELGHVVYRHPAWDAPASHSLYTGSMRAWEFSRSDVDLVTYVEVVPTGDPGIDGGTAQALRAGRAPIPSSYLAGGKPQQGDLGSFTAPEYIIETDDQGKVTDKGRSNLWYQRQLRYGVRPRQVQSPLLFTQEQAQAQAEGLLRFWSRLIKTADITIPGSPQVRLGETIQVYGPLEDKEINRSYYVEKISQEYVEGDHFTTRLGLTHGRDPWDPAWGEVVIPKFDPASLTKEGGIMRQPQGGGQGAGGGVMGAIGANGYSFVVPPGAKFSEERVDRGQDFSTSPGGPVLAIGNGVVTAAHGSFPLYGAGPCFKLLDGPAAGRYVFVMHARACHVSVGARVRAGQVISSAGGVGGGGGGHIEYGFATGPGGGLMPGAPGTHYARSGQEMHDLLHAIAPSRVRRQAIIG